MKRRFILIILSIIATCQVCRASEPEFHIGGEWGFAATVFRQYYAYYLYDGEAVLDTEDYFLILATGHALLNAGIYFSDKFEASILGGIMGIHTGRMVAPVLARFSYYPSGYHSKGFFCFADGGPALGVTKNEEASGICSICHLGGAYRCPLSSKFSLDFKLAARAAFDHPGIKDPYSGGYIPVGNVRKSKSNMYALELSLAIDF